MCFRAYVSQRVGICTGRSTSCAAQSFTHSLRRMNIAGSRRRHVVSAVMQFFRCDKPFGRPYAEISLLYDDLYSAFTRWHACNDNNGLALKPSVGQQIRQCRSSSLRCRLLQMWVFTPATASLYVHRGCRAILGRTLYQWQYRQYLCTGCASHAYRQQPDYERFYVLLVYCGPVRHQPLQRIDPRQR